MGEIAEMMLDGTLCEGCGSYMGSGSGYPQYCSKQCARDRGAMNDPDDFLYIENETDLEKIKEFLSGRIFNKVNPKKKDRKSQPMIGLMQTHEKLAPDKRGLIVCKNADLHKKALELVEAA